MTNLWHIRPIIFYRTGYHSTGVQFPLASLFLQHPLPLPLLLLKPQLLKLLLLLLPPALQPPLLVLLLLLVILFHNLKSCPSRLIPVAGFVVKLGVDTVDVAKSR